MFAAYCLYHLVFGMGGISKYYELKSERIALEQQLDTVKMERAALEDKVVRMRPGSLDLDLLDEQAYKMIGRGIRKSDEVIILQGS